MAKPQKLTHNDIIKTKKPVGCKKMLPDNELNEIYKISKEDGMKTNNPRKLLDNPWRRKYIIIYIIGI